MVTQMTAVDRKEGTRTKLLNWGRLGRLTRAAYLGVFLPYLIAFIQVFRELQIQTEAASRTREKLVISSVKETLSSP